VAQGVGSEFKPQYCKKKIEINVRRPMYELVQHTVILSTMGKNVYFWTLCILKFIIRVGGVPA
jgi:hypothetical protein